MTLTTQQTEQLSKVDSVQFTNVRDPQGHDDPHAAWILDQVSEVYVNPRTQEFYLNVAGRGLISRDQLEQEYHIRFDISGSI